MLCLLSYGYSIFMALFLDDPIPEESPPPVLDDSRKNLNLTFPG